MIFYYFPKPILIYFFYTDSTFNKGYYSIYIIIPSSIYIYYRLYSLSNYRYYYN